jgi:hypothetical protein
MNGNLATNREKDGRIEGVVLHLLDGRKIVERDPQYSKSILMRWQA